MVLSLLLMIFALFIFSLPAVLVAFSSPISLPYTLIAFIGLSIIAASHTTRYGLENEDNEIFERIPFLSTIKRIWFISALFFIISAGISGLILVSAGIATTFATSIGTLPALIVALVLPEIDARLGRRFKISISNLCIIGAVNALRLGARIYAVRQEVISQAEHNARSFITPRQI